MADHDVTRPTARRDKRVSMEKPSKLPCRRETQYRNKPRARRSGFRVFRLANALTCRQGRTFLHRAPIAPNTKELWLKTSKRQVHSIPAMPGTDSGCTGRHHR